MTILVAPDSFKDCASAVQVAAALARGLRRGWPSATVVELPVADGGEGTVEALVAATGGQLRVTRVADPLGRPVDATWGLLGDHVTAVIEMAAASGLELLDLAERNPLLTSTRGTGQLVAAALDHGARRFVIGIGGSATTDAGCGLAVALGTRLLDAAGQPVEPVGGQLHRVARIDPSGLDPRLADCEVQVACDVDNPLCGPRGASRVYGPQKGADEAAVEHLDRALGQIAERFRLDLGVDCAELPGAGAAGGLGAGLVACCGARLTSGIDLVLDTLAFDRRLDQVDCVVTGEGRIDPSTLHGKTVHGVVRRAAPRGIPVIAVGGAITGDPAAYRAAGLTAVLGLPPRPATLAEALAEAPAWLEQTGESIARLLRLGAGFAPA